VRSAEGLGVNLAGTTCIEDLGGEGFRENSNWSRVTRS